MTAVLPSPKTTLVILLGASKWPFSPEFQASKAFLNSAIELREYFLNPSQFGLPPENLLNLFNSNQSADDMDGEIGLFLERRIAEMKQIGESARDLVVYFIGHGGFVGNDSDYYLAIRRTRTDNPSVSGIRMVSLAHTLKEKARYLRRIVILDCCFAGAAFRAFQSGPALTAIIQTLDAFKVQGKGIGVPERGTSLLCSSGHKTPSLISQDGLHTIFSKTLLQALSTGNPRQQDDLTLRNIADLTEDALHAMAEKNAPRPEVHSPDQADGNVAEVPFFPNLAVKGAKSSQTLPSQTSHIMQSLPPLGKSPTSQPAPPSPVQTSVMVPLHKPLASQRVRTSLLIGLVLAVLALFVLALFLVVRPNQLATDKGSPTATALSSNTNATVNIVDQAGVLNADQVKSEGANLLYPLYIYTVNNFTGSESAFNQEAVRTLNDKNDPRLIVIAIDTRNKFLSIVGGKDVSSSNNVYNDAVNAFKNNYNGGDYTGATIAAIRSLRSSLQR